MIAVRESFKEEFTLLSDRKQLTGNVRTVVDSIVRSRATYCITEKEVYQVIKETITNAMEHGNKWDPKKTLSASVELHKNNIEITVTDQGTGFDRSQQKTNTNKTILRNRGHGLLIMSKLCTLQWNKSGNSVTIRIDTV